MIKKIVVLNNKSKQKDIEMLSRLNIKFNFIFILLTIIELKVVCVSQCCVKICYGEEKKLILLVKHNLEQAE